jgi:tRNA modification GTPase
MCLETLQECGVQTCTWQQLERLTADVPLRAAATAALAEARTARTAAILLDQFRGAFERVVREVLAALDNQEQATAGCILGELTARAALGRHLTTPWRVVIAGAPNVGKSSVVNALAGYQRSIVSPTPGTTRDVVGTSIAIDGWPVELSDTAGLRGQAESLEEQGMRRAHEAIAVADLCVWVLDGSTVPVEPPFASDRWLRVINKVDLPPAWDWEREPDALRVSAQTGAGIADLCAALGRRLVPEPPPSGSAVPFTLELCAGIGKAERALGDGDPAGARQILAELLDAV